jgi:hypothetical protein
LSILLLASTLAFCLASKLDWFPMFFFVFFQLQPRHQKRKDFFNYWFISSFRHYDTIFINATVPTTMYQEFSIQYMPMYAHIYIIYI